MIITEQTNDHGVRLSKLAVGARIVVTGAAEPIYGTVTRMVLPRLGWFAYDSPAGGSSADQAMFHFHNVLAVVDLWEPFGDPVDGYCCVDAHASGRRWHTGGCAWRCRKPVRITNERFAYLFNYPCPLGAAHTGACDLPEQYR